LPFPLPTATETFPFPGELWSAVAPAWALWAFALGAPLPPLACSAAFPGEPPEALPVALALPLALPLPLAPPAGCRAPGPAGLGSDVTELVPVWLPEGVVGWLSARAAGAATSRTRAAAEATRAAVPAFVALLHRELTAQTV
jgi:hypothetical protein